MSKTSKFIVREKILLACRSFCLNALALGSLVATYLIGNYIGSMIFINPLSIAVVTSFFMFAAYMSIDYVLKVLLASASDVPDDNGKASKTGKTGKTSKATWRLAVGALIATFILSVVSIPFTTHEITRTNDLKNFNAQVFDAMRRDSSLKVDAIETLSSMKSDFKRELSAARREKRRLIEAAVAKGSKSWQSDYRLAKSDKSSWFWVCTKCSKSYRAYRQSIINAEQRGDQIIAAARTKNDAITRSLSSTLEYQVSKDSMLQFVQSNVAQGEVDRQQTKSLLGYVFLAMTIIFGGLAMGLTFVVKDHRRAHGQHVTNEGGDLALILIDFNKRLGDICINVLYNLTLRPFEFLQQRGLILEYAARVVESSGTHGTVDTDSDASTAPSSKIKPKSKPSSDKPESRSCQHCGMDISHKRSDAKFCSSACRTASHNFNLK